MEYGRRTHLPERDDGGVIRIEDAAILRVSLQVVHIHRGVGATDQDLQFLLIKHPTKSYEPAGQTILEQ